MSSIPMVIQVVFCEQTLIYPSIVIANSLLAWYEPFTSGIKHVYHGRAGSIAGTHHPPMDLSPPGLPGPSCSVVPSHEGVTERIYICFAHEDSS